MTAPTFPLHSHRHISAVAIVFEDTVGRMYSTDSVGTNHHFGAGDVHWTLAGSGVEHTQTPTNGSSIHAVQMFIDLPENLRNSPAKTFHLKAKEVPVFETDGCRVRILAGTVLGLSSPLAVQQDILIVEGWSKSAFSIPIPDHWKAWIYDRDNEAAGYANSPSVDGHFLMVASPW
jgi:redox-sensitive bicupin YhaK (pirin superfamily)